MFVPSPGGRISGWEEKPLIRIVISKPSLLMLIYRRGFKGEIEVLLPLKDSDILKFGHIVNASFKISIWIIFNRKVSIYSTFSLNFKK